MGIPIDRGQVALTSDGAVSYNTNTKKYKVKIQIEKIIQIQVQIQKHIQAQIQTGHKVGNSTDRGQGDPDGRWRRKSDSRPCRPSHGGWSFMIAF